MKSEDGAGQLRNQTAQSQGPGTQGTSQGGGWDQAQPGRGLRERVSIGKGGTKGSMEMGKEWVAFWCERPRDCLAAGSIPGGCPRAPPESIVASVSGVEGGGQGWEAE